MTDLLMCDVLLMLSVLVNLMAPSSFRGLSAVLMFGPPSPLSLSIPCI